VKTGIATVLSLSGVLAAGTAAAVVNASVLRPSTPSTASSDAAHSVAVINTVDPSSSVNIAPPPATQALYRVGEAGSVLIDTSGDVLGLVSVTPQDEWVVVSATSSGATAEVVFQHEQEIVRFTASLVSGVVIPSTSEEQLAPPSTTGSVSRPAPSTTSPESHDDHDNEDDHEDDSDDDD